jgi:hypothetical protein
VQLWWKGVDGTRRAFAAAKKRKVFNIGEKEENDGPKKGRLIDYMNLRVFTDFRTRMRKG